MTRFDEVDLRKHDSEDDESPAILPSAPRSRRFATFAIDLSLFAALTIAMSPLLAQRAPLLQLIAFVSFLLLLSYYYFVLCWLIWGKTVGGAILEVRVIGENGAPVDLPSASRRWLATLLTILTGGLGFIPILFPLARTLPDRLSRSVPVHSP